MADEPPFPFAVPVAPGVRPRRVPRHGSATYPGSAVRPGSATRPGSTSRPDSAGRPDSAVRPGSASLFVPAGMAHGGFRRPKPPRRSPIPLIAGTVAVLIVLLGVAVGLDQRSAGTGAAGAAATGATPPPSAPATPPQSPAQTSPPAAPQTSAPGGVAPVHRTGHAKKVRLGVFRGTEPAQVRAFERWLGADVPYALDFSSRDSWRDIADPEYMIEAWQGSGRRMVYSVALLPSDGDHSMRRGARGDYDRYFRELARNLVAGGQEDAILRLGWEFNLTAWKWSTDDPQDFIAYWRHIVRAMRSVPGQDFEFDWNVNVGDTAHEAHRYYPGGSYVDYVGVDAYDISWTPDTYPYPRDCDGACRLARQKQVWDRIHGGHYGLLYWSDFARSKKKPMSLPEWGLWDRPDGHGGGDNPYFIEQMHAFVDDPQNRVAYQVYFEVDVADGDHRLATFTRAGATFRRLFAPDR